VSEGIAAGGWQRPIMNRNDIDHDQRFKQVLEAFFADFLRLFAPATAARLDLSTVTFRSPEIFTDIPQGERRTADIVAEARTLQGNPELVLLHAETQRQRRRDFAYRMWQYYILLRQRENLPVIPIALVFYPARDGITREEYRESVFGETIVTFRYLQISLPRLSAQDYVQHPVVLGAGLASVMDLPRARAAQIQLHLAALRRVLDAARAGEVNAAQAFLLASLVDTYLPLSIEERAEVVELEQGGNTTMDVPTDAPTLEWAQQLFRDNALHRQREDIRRLVRLKFGQVTTEVEAVIDAVRTEEEANSLFDRAFAVQTESGLLQSIQ